MRETFDARSIAVFEQNLAGVGVADLAAAHGMSEEAVYAARRRIRVRMQELVGQQVEDEDRIDDRSVRLAG